MADQRETGRSSPTASVASWRPDETPKRIGPYKILELLGEGGMGVVYLAEQTEPVRRRVALKIIKVGMDTRQVVARFEAERQALALMDHPNVAKVLDAGSTDTGRPFFVMEHVAGIPITEHCDKQRLSIDARLKIFMQVCGAVQHAHHKGIIHRDIKPSNVLVSTKDGVSVPKVIDFGVAKAIHQKLTEQTLFTEQGQIIGTPEYMSPEQAEMTAQDIDTRSDVYSLGVLLYELLTGERPFSSEKLRQAGMAEMHRVIREEDPPKPSTRLSGGGDDPTTRARSRRADPRTLMRCLRGDLDWIVMKAIEKDRERRYETANGLAADLRRHLQFEPVRAGPPGAAYRIAKFVRRNRIGVTAAGLILLVLLAGIAGTTWGLLSAIEARDAETVAKEAAKEQARLASLARDAEAAARAESEQRAEELAQVVEFQAAQLGEIDLPLMAVRLRREVLAEAHAAMKRAKHDEDDIAERLTQFESLMAGTSFTDVALGTLDDNVFEAALIAVDEQFADQPLVRARLLQTMAATMKDLGLLGRATRPQTDALAIRRRTLGDAHPDTLASINGMGSLLWSQGKLGEAEAYWREALDGRRELLGVAHPDTLRSINDMGILLHSQRKHAEAEQYFREALDGLRQAVGDDRPSTLRSINNMGYVLQSQGRLDEAERYFREALERRRRIHGDDHASTLLSLYSVGSVLSRQGNHAEAKACCRDALEGFRGVLGNEHPHTLMSITAMGLLLRTEGKLVEAEPYFREALEGYRRTLGDEHPMTLIAFNNMGVLLRRQGKPAEAERYHRQALEIRRRVLGPEHPDTLASMNGAGGRLWSQGKLDEAEPYWREVLAIRRRMNGDEHRLTLLSINNMGMLLQSQGRLDESEQHFREAYETRRRTLGDEAPVTLFSLTNLGAVVNAQGRYVDAETLLRESLETGEVVFGETDWRLALTRSLLGESLAGQGRFDEAEPLQLDGYRGLESSLTDARRARRLPPAIERLVKLYEAWGKPESANQWRATLEEARTKTSE